MPLHLPTLVPRDSRAFEPEDADGESRRPLLVPDEQYLASRNPVFTAEQRTLERLALRLWENPVVVRARTALATRWRTIAGRDVPDEAWARFDELVEEFAFNDVLKAANSDSNHPRVLGMIWAPPREWWGTRVPGSRGSGGDSPENHFTLIPLDGLARFVVEGQCFEPRPADVPLCVMTDTVIATTGAVLAWQDVVVDDRGRFRVTLGPDPGDGSAQHLQIPRDARWLLIRSCRKSWRDVPVAVAVHRIDPPTAPPMSEQQLADRAARWMLDHVPPLYWYMRVFAALDANTVTPPFVTGDIGGLVTQLISFIRLDLADDEAYVVTFGNGDAPFRDCVLHDWWFRTIDYWERQTSLCVEQAAPGEDGTTTYVICAHDPGVQNWLDTTGLRNTLVVHRWQNMPREPGRALPQARGRMVKRADLPSALPAGMRFLSAQERATQIEERRRTFQLRLMTH